MQGKIGVFDSGYGGLTILKDIRRALPQYDYLYLGDNARAPYGPRSFEVVYQFTLQAVRFLFEQNCPLVILACNTASAKALRTIQQHDLPLMADPTRRVLGVIRPTAEVAGELSRTRHIGVMGTPGTIASQSFNIEIAKLSPDITVTARSAPMWVPLVEYGEAQSPGADYFVQREADVLMASDPDIDTVLLACTHYPILYPKIRAAFPERVNVVRQGPIVAASLADYLHRHQEMAARLSTGGTCDYLTTETPEKFASIASLFLGQPVIPRTVTLS